MFAFCAKGNLDQLKPLVEAAEDKNPKNFNSNLLEAQDKNPMESTGWTLLHCAAMHGQVKVVEYLVSVVDDKSPKFLGETPLDYARLSGHTEVVKVLQGSEVKPLDQSPWNFARLWNDLSKWIIVYVVLLNCYTLVQENQIKTMKEQSYRLKGLDKRLEEKIFQVLTGREAAGLPPSQAVTGKSLFFSYH